MSGYLDIILVALFAWCAFESFAKKEMTSKRKRKIYTKESREKFAIAAGFIYTFLALFSLVYALSNHGILNIAFGEWTFYIVFLVIGCVGIFVCQKIFLKKTDEAVSGAKAEKNKSDEEEDF